MSPSTLFISDLDKDVCFFFLFVFAKDRSLQLFQRVNLCPFPSFGQEEGENKSLVHKIRGFLFLKEMHSNERISFWEIRIKRF